MPELSIRRFLAVDDAGQGKNVCAEFDIRDRGFEARSFWIPLTACESETAFGYVFAINDGLNA